MDGSNYITIAYNFLQLTINSIDEMSKQKNETLIIQRDGFTDKDFEYKFRWNDTNVGIPILFNFFHGVELMLKGLIIKCGGELPEKNHKLSELLNQLKNCPNPPSLSLIEHFNFILTKNGFDSFFETHDKNADFFYILFKYPEFRDGSDIEFWKLRGEGEEGLKRFENIRQLTISIKEEMIKWNTKKSTN